MVDVKKVSDEAALQQGFEVRRIVFVEEQDCPPELEYENEEVSTHFLAISDGQAAGAARWRRTEKGYKLERFAVLKEFRGRGVGKALVAAVLEDLPEDASYIYLHAQVQAMGLYKAMGFEAEGDLFWEAGIDHYKMVLRK